jgi:hypothetical protein
MITDRESFEIVSKARRFIASMEDDVLTVDLNSEFADATAYRMRRYGTSYDEPS